MLSGIGLLLVIFLAIAFLVVAASAWKLHPFVALLLATFGVGLATNMPLPTLIASINDGFGTLMGYIGLLVIFGSIIGIILEKSGAALKIASLLLQLVGQKRPALAMALIGATVSIPVFCDSGFIILAGLNEAIAKKTKVKKASLALALAAGLYTTHTLIPPTPGPITAAGNIGAGDYLGTIMLLGFFVSMPTLLVSWLFAKWKGQQLDADTSAAEDLPATLPSAFAALLPILLPIILIAMGTFVKWLALDSTATTWLTFLGHPLVALFLGMLAAFRLLPSWDQAYLTDWIGEGIRLAGPILVITGAGGAFGGVLKATPMADLLGSWVADGSYSGLFFLVIAFLIAALLKTAQGSSTNALVITSSMLAPLMPVVGFDTPLELGLMVMALGGGAMTVSHANDSYFWVVTQFSGIQMTDAYRSFTLLTGLQGLVVLGITLGIYMVSTLW